MAELNSKTTLYTIGYAGKTLRAFVDVLKKNRIESVIDIRQTPMSRQPGFSRNRLAEGLRKAGITYEHVAALGNPPQIRAMFHGPAITEGRKRYRQLLNNGRSHHVDWLVAVAEAQRTAIMCLESSPDQCHRQVVGEVAAERAAGSVKVREL
ncbi:MAG TPA: DUF488 domain-containing protein [Actinomycetota bacterium]